MINQFDCYTASYLLGTMLNVGEENPNWTHNEKILDTVFEKMKTQYQMKENTFKTLELNSEYYPIVIIRSLIPQLGTTIREKDYGAAYMVSEWIRVVGVDFSNMVDAYAKEHHINPRSLPAEFELGR